MNIDRLLFILERLLNLIRPKFYNRLTWVVVLAGLFLLASPWWSGVIERVIAKYLEIQVPESDSHLSWGLALVAIGLSYHALVHCISELIAFMGNSKNLEDQRAHDRRIFQEYSASILSEEDLEWLLIDMQDQHAYVSSQGNKLDRAVRYLLAPDKQFIDSTVQSAAKTLGSSLKHLRNWTALNFFPHGPLIEDGFRFRLYPDLHPDLGNSTSEDCRRYFEFAEELYTKVDDVKEKYGQFRVTVKRALAV